MNRKWIFALLLFILFLPFGLIGAWWLSTFFALNRFDHYDDPVLGYLREHRVEHHQFDIVPGLFKEGEERPVVVEQLRKSGFKPLLVRCKSKLSPAEVWGKPDKTYLFCVDLRFSQGRLEDADGRVFGPTLK